MKRILTIILILVVIQFNSSYGFPPSSNDGNLEFPRINEGDVILYYSAITIKYDTLRLIPNWVAYKLSKNEIQGDAERKSSFHSDKNYKGKQAVNSDYLNSGWDRGHMAPAADMKWSDEAMTESFCYTNVCPQNHKLNSYWWLALEKWCRTMAETYDTIYIVTGPLFDNNQYGSIGKRNLVQIPDGFFKAILSEKDGVYHSIAFVMKNNSDKQPFEDCSISVNSLEELSGIDFFTNLADSLEETIENENQYDNWSIISKSAGSH